LTRWARASWPLIFLLPLGIVAGQLCWINIVDPTYHGLLWLHERLISVLIILAIVSVSVATYRFFRVQDSLRLLLSLRAEPPADLERIFSTEADAQRVNAQLQYIDIPHRFCFTIFSGPSIIVSRGFIEQLDPRDLAMVAKHEVLHVRRRDPWRSIAWHLFFAGLVLPGFEPLETILHLRRERAVDTSVVQRSDDAQGYHNLLKRCSTRRDHSHGAICTNRIGADNQARYLDQVPQGYLWKRSAPALISLATLALVFVSHSFFLTNLQYLQTHHC